MLSSQSQFRFAAASAVLLALATPALAQRESPDGRIPERKGESTSPNARPADPRNDPKATDPDKRGDLKSLLEPRGRQKQADAAKEPKPIPRYMRRPGATAVPEGGAARALLLTELYAHLATATDEDVAKQVANAIEHVWHAAGSDTVHLLLDRAMKAAAEKKLPLALSLFDRAVQLNPDNPDVFARRAAVFYAENDLDNAMGDLRRVLALDRNHYKALDGLAQILKDTGRKKAALEVFRQLYAAHPYYPGAKSAIDELQREVEGQGS